MISNSFDAIYIALAAIIFWALFRGIRAGEFGSAYGEKLSINRATNPFLFWAQALVVFATGVLLAWAGFF